MKPELFTDAPAGTLPTIFETGYINAELLTVWLRHFAQHTKPTEDDPMLSSLTVTPFIAPSLHAL